MTSPAGRGRSQFIDAVIDGYATAHSTPPDAEQLELQRITQDKTGRAAGMQIGDDQAVLMEMLVRAMLTRLRPGGLILLDNMLQGGHVADDLPDDENVAAIRSLNDAIAADPRVKVVLVPIGDGVSFVQKLGERQ